MLTVQERHQNISARGQGRGSEKKNEEEKGEEARESPAGAARSRRPRAQGAELRRERRDRAAGRYDSRTICATPTMAPRMPPSRMRIHSSSWKIGCNKFSNLSGGILSKASLFFRSMSVIWPM